MFSYLKRKHAHCHQIYFILCSYNCVAVIFHHLNSCFPGLDIYVCTCKVHRKKKRKSTCSISALGKCLFHSEVAKAAEVHYRNKYNEIVILKAVLKGILSCCSYHFTSYKYLHINQCMVNNHKIYPTPRNYNS